MSLLQKKKRRKNNQVVLVPFEKVMNKKVKRLRRASKARAKIRDLAISRLSVHRTSQHIYAQVFSADGSSVVAAASTLQAEIKAQVQTTSNKGAASIVGKAVATKAKAAGVEKVAFDRSGFRYHGRVKALAEAAREAGLKF